MVGEVVEVYIMMQNDWFDPYLQCIALLGTHP